MTRELFEKVYINSEADLPTDSGQYLFHDKVMGGMQTFTCPGSKEVMRHFREECDWYLRPLPPAEGAEKLGNEKQYPYCPTCGDTIEHDEDYGGYCCTKCRDGHNNDFAAQPTAEEPQLTAEAGHAICVRCIFKVNYDKFDKARVAYEKLTAQRQQQPTAEGAEMNARDILFKIPDFRFWQNADGSDTTHCEYALKAMDKFATLHAQKFADKMVSERLREELIAYDKWLCQAKWGEKIWSIETTVDEYLKTRESHE